MADPKPTALPSTSVDSDRPTALVRPTTFLVATSIVIGAAIALIAVMLLVHLYDEATTRTRQTLSSLDIVLAEQTEQALDSVDLTLRDTLNLLVHKKGAASAKTIGSLYGGADVHDLLRAEWGNMPQLADITIFDARGRLVNSSDSAAPPNLDVSFRQYFQRARDNPTPVKFISEPVKFQTIDMHAVLLVQRLEAPDGSFAGIITGTIPLDYFTSLYRDIYLGPGTGVALFRRDGLLLVRYPSIPAVGKNLASELAFTQVLAQSASDVTHGTGKLGGEPLFIATHALTNFPLAVNVIMTDKRAYAQWRNELIGIVIALMVILGMVTLLTVLALRHFASYVNLAEARLETNRATEARARAEAMTQAKSRFLANMSHELRTPLNAIIGFSEIIETAMLGPLQQRYREYAHDIRGAGAHLLEIVNDILDLSKAEANALKVGHKPLDVAAIVSEVDRIVRAQAERAKVSFDTRLDPDLPPVMGDETRLRQILINLVSNALKFTPAGGSVTVSARKTARHMVIEVKDTGIGMAEEDIPAALRPFEQLDNSIARKYDGAGLGLPLTKHLVELLGGRFSITSAVNEGTTVAIEFECQRRAA
ncbi:MAG TPA: ATP-binding protein [Stellaceae bacterium]|nr:ATP-binding protein [Stellaceae bacterium]